MDLQYEELLKSIQVKDKELINKSLQRLSLKIQKILYLHLTDWTLVPDLAQEILFKVTRSLHTFRGDSQFSTWLYQIINNTLKNHYRTLVKHDTCSIDEVIDVQSADTINPEQSVMFMEMYSKIETVLLSMPFELRECMGRFIYDGDSYEVIAKKMNCPLGTVRSRIHRARQLLSEAFEENNKCIQDEVSFSRMRRM